MHFRLILDRALSEAGNPFFDRDGIDGGRIDHNGDEITKNLQKRNANELEMRKLSEKTRNANEHVARRKFSENRTLCER